MSQGDVVFFVCGEDHTWTQNFSGVVRKHLAEKADLIEDNVLKLCWVVDFPLYERDQKTGQLIFSHNPFSMPQCAPEDFDSQDPLDILAYQYDLVCNGVEIGSGAIRNHNPDLLVKAFVRAGHQEERVQEDFQSMLKAFAYGAPPHGGCAPGIDRIIMLLSGEENIREVIAFPKNQSAMDVLMGAPSPVRAKQLEELYIKCVTPPQNNNDA